MNNSSVIFGQKIPIWWNNLPKYKSKTDLILARKFNNITENTNSNS